MCPRNYKATESAHEFGSLFSIFNGQIVINRRQRHSPTTVEIAARNDGRLAPEAARPAFSSLKRYIFNNKN